MERKNPAGNGDVAIEDDERHSDAVDSYIARNRDALNSSIKKSRADLANGHAGTKSVEDIIRDGRSRYSKDS